MNRFSLFDKVIIITGASSGLGKACAIECAVMGAKLVLLGRDVDRLNETLAEINKLPESSASDSLIYSVDLLNDLDELANIIDDAVSKLGKVDGFIHAAGVEKTLPVSSLKSSDYETIFKVNTVSGFELAKIASKKKYVSDKASFVFISSITAVIGRVGVVAYAASKGALVSGSKSMALELAAKNIRVNCICPGTILTPMMVKYLESISEEEQEKRKEGFPLGLGETVDVANAAIFLLSDASKWITGQNLVVDGGYTAR
ncbi:MAG: SDR family oxidoreductase [Flavobacterium sp. JAD_PAG50586_2]|nr:MAG: SDR family oxidoreductase [Flavobacterium sp. JAD_PAG50586_2]